MERVSGTVRPQTPFWWSDRFRKLLGYKDETDFPNVLDSWGALLHPNDKDITFEAFGALHRAQRLGAADGRLHHQITAQRVVVAHVRPAQAKAANALRKKAVNAGTATFIVKRQRSGTGQTESLIDLLEQQHAAIADDVPALECGLDNSPSNPPKLNSLIGTLWHRRSSVLIGVRSL